MKIVYSMKNGDYIESENGEISHFYYRFDEEAINKAFEFGMEEAWETARKISKMDYEKSVKIFGSKHIGEEFWEHYSASDAIEKLKEYKEKNEIKVGDEIISSESKERALVMRIYKDGTFECISHDCFFTISGNAKTHWSKTGKHYDEIERTLNELKESEK